MGGVIGFTLREENGTEHRMSRWTNWTPWAIDNIELARKSPKHIEDILYEWKKQLLLPADHEEKNWAYNEPFLAPSEYGLVVVDLLHNKILDCNGYHHFGFTNLVSLALEMNSPDFDDHGRFIPESVGLNAFLQDNENDAARFYHFLKDKKIKDFVIWDLEKGEYVSYGKDINSLSLEELVSFISVDGQEAPVRYGKFALDMSPLEVVTFPESPEGYAAFRQAVLDLGFVLTEEEEKIWDERINPDDEDEGGEDEGDDEDEDQPMDESELIISIVDKLRNNHVE